MKRVVLVCVLLIAFAAEARIGGGHTYGGGSSSSSSGSSSDSSSSDDYSSSDDSPPSSSPRGSSSSGGGSSPDGGVAGVVLFLLFGLLFLAVVTASSSAANRVVPLTITSAPPPPAAPVDLSALRRFDPNFSEIVFTDFCYSLFARLYEARGRGGLDDLAPYVSPRVREGLRRHSPAGLTSVDAIVIGSFTIVSLHGLDRSHVSVNVDFDANYSEVSAHGTRRWYVREVWTLDRARDLLSPRPEKARAEHCPKCGAALETRTDGACLHCGAVVTDGTFHWYLQSIRAIRKDERAPELGGGGGIEPGLTLPTVMQPSLGRHGAAFAQRSPGFNWQDFYGRVYLVATELQSAWAQRDWHRARPFETDALFQTHRYWIDEYLRQGLRNIVAGYSIDKVEVVKVTDDAFYDAITVRLWASGMDYTIDDGGTVVGGSPHERRAWSEYWTFIRGRAGAPADSRVCPNCGGALEAGQTAICAYCGGKVTTGEFPWVLSRIEQDEAYRG